MADLPEDPAELMKMARPLGLLEVLGSGSGFIRRRESGYAPGDDDIYVPSRVIQKYGLRTGDELMGIVADTGNSSERAHRWRTSRLVNDHPARGCGNGGPEFNKLSAMHPDQQLMLECGRTWRGEPELTNRVIDLFCPIGKGQRAMIVAPAKAGKTTVMQAIAEGIVKNHPECHLMILLVDERPEEVTEMEQCGFGEVIASTFDRPPERHVQVAEMTLERARRRVEQGEDVVIILDSITRMARAYNSLKGGSGRTMSGGLDTNALEKPKRFLGSAARKIAPEPGRWIADDHRNGARRHRFPHGPGHLRGVQGDRKQRAGSLPRSRGQAHLPGDRHHRVGHAEGRAAAGQRPALDLARHATAVRRSSARRGDDGAARRHAEDEHQPRPHRVRAESSVAEGAAGGSAGPEAPPAAASSTISARRSRLFASSVLCAPSMARAQ